MVTRIIILFFCAVTAFAAQIPPASRVKTWAPNVTTTSTTIGVGNPGGIYLLADYRTPCNVMDFGADNTGATACDSAVAAMLAACGPTQFPYLPPGRFRLDNPLVYYGQITGAGIGVTILDMRCGGSNAIRVGEASNFTNPTGPNTFVTAGLSAGSSTVTLGSSSGFSVGNGIRIFFSDDVDQAAVEAGTLRFVTIPWDPPGYSRSHMAKITAISGNDITFDPPIIHSPAAGSTAYARCSETFTTGGGLYNLTIDCTNSSATVGVGVYDKFAFFMKNVEIIRAARYHVSVYNCAYFEMRGCIINEAQLVENSNTSGLLMHTSLCSLVEDNAFIGTTPGWEINFSSVGNVFAFNFFDRATANINHGATNYYNLYEGNLVSQIKSDGYFGGSIRDILFRNWFTGRASRTNTAITVGMVEMKRLTYESTHVGNYYGTSASNVTRDEVQTGWGLPNIGNTNSQGTAKPSAGLWWIAWNPSAATPRSWSGTVSSGGGTTSGVLDFPGMSDPVTGFALQALNAESKIVINWSGDAAFASVTYSSISGNLINTSSVRSTSDENVPKNLPANGTAITVATHNSSFQEKDLDVKESAYYKRNYYISATGGQTGWATGEEDIGSDTVPNSLFRSSKPAFFGNKPWPVFDTARATEPSYTDLPAAHRYINGNTDYMPGGSPAPRIKLPIGRGTHRR